MLLRRKCGKPDTSGQIIIQVISVIFALGYFVDNDGKIYDQPSPKESNRKSKIQNRKSVQPISRLGARKAVLGDLSPAATFIAYNYNTPVDVKAFEREAARILQEVEAECGWMYETLHTDGKTKGKINYTVWSDVFQCPECGTEIVFWDVAVDEEAGKVLDPFLCPQCGVDLRKRNLERTWEIVYDSVLNQTIRRAKQAPVLINYSLGKKRYTKQPNLDDLDLIRRVEESNTSYWLPTDPLPDGYNTRQPMESHGITHAHHFYTLRNLLVLASIWDRILSAEVPNRLILGFCFTANLRSVSRLASIAFSYYFKGGGGPINAGTKGTLYVSSTVPEVSVLKRVVT